jgi:perosamine synthetase
MAPDGQTLAPNLLSCRAYPRGGTGRAIERMLISGDLFRYTAPKDAPVAAWRPNLPN